MNKILLGVAIRAVPVVAIVALSAVPIHFLGKRPVQSSALRKQSSWSYWW